MALKATAAGIATRDELLSLLSEASRKGHVGAMRLLLEELRRDGEDGVEAKSIVDELAQKRTAVAG